MKTVKLVVVAGAFFTLGVAMSSEPQPKMKEALAHLNKAENSLKAATADKGGHRIKALGLVNDAIAEVKKGIAYDNKK
ncbi:MAG: hypothetical protein ACHQF2_05880 [Flavobacteriales bacterium]